MKHENTNEPKSARETESLPEYDFEKMELQQGRTTHRLRDIRNRRTLKPDLAARFPDDASVNAALGEYLLMKARSA